METRTALVVDDDALEREYMTELLSRNSLTVRSAASIPNASGMAKGMHFDYVFIDELMPGADPVSSLEEIRSSMQSREPDKEAYILMGDSSEVSAKGYRSLGYNGFLDKPVDPGELKIALAENQKEERDKLFSLEDLDIAAGISNCGSRENYLSALKIFHDTYANKANEIRERFNRGDLKTYTVKVHALKSSARIIGAKQLSELAEKLEEAGGKGDTAEIESSTSKLLDMYESMGAQLDGLFEEESKDKPLASDDTVADAFRSIIEFAKFMDYDLVRMVLDSVTKEFSLKKEDADRFSRIDDALVKLDWDAVSSEAAAYES